MGQTWKTHVIILIAINFPDLISCYPLDETADSLNYPVEFVYPNDDGSNDELEKRLSSFVRIGRGLSSFIRIGKSGPEFAGFESETSDGDIDDGEFQKRKSAFVRIGRGDEPEADKRLSSFVRIGKGGDETEPYFAPQDKRGGAFIRLGKFPSAAFVRNRSGKIHSIASPPYYRRSGRIGHSSFIRIGKRDTRDALKQTNTNDFNEEQFGDYMSYNQNNENIDRLIEPLKDLRNENEKRMSSFVRIGRQGDGYIPDYLYGNAMYNEPLSAVGAKRMSKFVRIGKNSNVDDMHKRMSAFVRIGKFYGTLNDKQISSFDPIGESSINGFTNGENKRMSKFVRIGKDMEVPNENFNSEKRRLSKFVRIGKDLELPNENFNAEKRRLSKFVRIGKDIDTLGNSVDQNEQQPEKRLSSFVRIGKSNDDKRMSSFVRIGKASDTNSADAIQTETYEDLTKDDLATKDD